MSTVHLEVLVGPPTPQVCGRCRGTFAGDATLPDGLDTGWWSCPPCQELLLGAGAMAMPARVAAKVRR